MKYALHILLAVFFSLTLMSASCKKQKKDDTAASPDTVTTQVVIPQNTEKNLWEMYQRGEISRCMWNGQTVYRCQMAHYDAETRIFDSNGKQIGACIYSMRKVDAMCNETKDCKVIYRVENNIWGKPAVNEIEK